MRDGAIVAEGPPDTVVTAELVEEVFGVAVRIFADPETGSPLVIPCARAVPHPVDTEPAYAGNRQHPATAPKETR